MATWTPQGKASSSTIYLLLENGDYLLQENGDKIVLSYGGWTPLSKNSSSWTQITKN